jgi:hypothetical protein
LLPHAASEATSASDRAMASVRRSIGRETYSKR